MNLDDPDDFDQLASLVKGFSNDTRLALLLGFYHGYTAKEITDFLGMTRGGLQNNINKMIAADLVYRPAAEDAPTYKLTPLGAFFARFFNAHGDTLLEVLDRSAQKEAQLQQDLTDNSLADGLTSADEAKLIHTNKWTAIIDDITQLLTQSPIRIQVPDHQVERPDLVELIVTTVAERTDRDNSELPPLDSAIDVSALEDLLQQAKNDSAPTINAVEFTYADKTVIVHSDRTGNRPLSTTDSSGGEHFT